MNYMIFILTGIESEARRNVILHMVVFIYWLQFIEYLLSAWPCIKHFTCIILCNPRNHTVREVLFQTLFRTRKLRFRVFK